MIRATVVLALALAFVASAQANDNDNAALYGGYRYNGRPTCANSATVSLNAAQVAPGKNSHAAVWSGVYEVGGDGPWVQAGVTQDGDGTAPWAYLEWSTRGGQYRLVNLGPATALKVRLVQQGKAWTITVGKRSATVRLGAQTRCFLGAESEDWGSRNVVRGEVVVHGARPFKVGL